VLPNYKEKQGHDYHRTRKLDNSREMEGAEIIEVENRSNSFQLSNNYKVF
jgi:hypothetical protein